jgi:hypothetical protein
VNRRDVEQRVTADGGRDTALALLAIAAQAMEAAAGLPTLGNEASDRARAIAGRIDTEAELVKFATARQSQRGQQVGGARQGAQGMGHGDRGMRR